MKAIISDIDGTLRDGVSPNPTMIGILNDYFEEGYLVIIVTDEPTTAQADIQKWLKDNKVSFSALITRPDSTSDLKVKDWKEAAVTKYLASKGLSMSDVEVAFDNIKGIAKRWKKLGVHSFLVM